MSKVFFFFFIIIIIIIIDVMVWHITAPDLEIKSAHILRIFQNIL